MYVPCVLYFPPLRDFKLLLFLLRLDSAPPSASLIRDWLDLVGDMGDINMELLLQQGWTENTPTTTS